MRFVIAHISKPGSKNNNSYKNYYFEKINIKDNMQWDDTKKNTLENGDFIIFYCWGKRVEIHKIINVTTDLTKRRAHWNNNECNVLYLSPCLNTYSFKKFGTYDPPYSVYKQGFKKKNVYDLHKYPKLQYELNIIKENLTDKKINHCGMISQMIKNYYTLLLDHDDCWGSNGFISVSYRSESIQSGFKRNIFENVDGTNGLIEKKCYLNYSNSLYQVSNSVVDDYKKIILHYCMGT